MTRRNFTKAVRVEIVKRSMRNGQTYCEAPNCGQPCKRFEIHHLTSDAMETNKSRRLTAADGALWCLPCHSAETKAQAPILAKARAREAAHLKANPAPKRPMASGSRPKPEKAPPKPPVSGLSNIARRFATREPEE